MSKYDVSWDKKPSSESQGKHVDAKINKNYFEKIWKSQDLQEKAFHCEKNCDSDPAGGRYFHKEYMGIDPYWINEGERRVKCFQELTGVRIAWRKNGVNSGFSLSFHQPSVEFQRECEKMLGIKDKVFQTPYKNWND